MPLIFLFFLFLAIWAEMSVMISMGTEIGALGVIAASILTAAIGLMLVRIQGFGVYTRMMQASAQGETPVDEMLHGVLLLFSGVLLIIPGFITDGIGALLLVPFIRSEIITHGFLKNFKPFPMQGPRGGPGPSTFIEGEFEQQEENEPEPPVIEGKKKN